MAGFIVGSGFIGCASTLLKLTLREHCVYVLKLDEFIGTASGKRPVSDFQNGE